MNPADQGRSHGQQTVRVHTRPAGSLPGGGTLRGSGVPSQFWGSGQRANCFSLQDCTFFTRKEIMRYVGRTHEGLWLGRRMRGGWDCPGGRCGSFVAAGADPRPEGSLILRRGVSGGVLPGHSLSGGHETQAGGAGPRPGASLSIIDGRAFHQAAPLSGLDSTGVIIGHHDLVTGRETEAHTGGLEEAARALREGGQRFCLALLDRNREPSIEGPCLGHSWFWVLQPLGTLGNSLKQQLRLE